jgi:chromosome segregation ATPase
MEQELWSMDEAPSSEDHRHQKLQLETKERELESLEGELKERKEALDSRDELITRELGLLSLEREEAQRKSEEAENVKAASEAARQRWETAKEDLSIRRLEADSAKDQAEDQAEQLQRQRSAVDRAAKAYKQAQERADLTLAGATEKLDKAQRMMENATTLQHQLDMREATRAASVEQLRHNAQTAIESRDRALSRLQDFRKRAAETERQLTHRLSQQQETIRALQSQVARTESTRALPVQTDTDDPWSGRRYRR